jgi:cobalt/nickel transport system ATP-binding protein
MTGIIGPSPAPPVGESRGELLEVENLGHRYASGQWALAGVSFRMRLGERVALVGPNGAGKTTLLMHLNGLLTGVRLPTGPTMPPGPKNAVSTTSRTIATEPPVRVLGMPVNRQNSADVRRIGGLMFQDPDDQLFCATIGEDVAFGPRNLGLPAEEVRRRVDRSLAQVGLAAEVAKPPSQLSFGVRRRACLAGVLACEPELLALDEPSSNLDPRGRRELIDLLAILPAAQLIATHDLEMVLDLCPRTLILDSGRIVADGQSREILADATLMTNHGLEIPLSLRLGRR